MIVGIGCDIIEISRIEKHMNDEKFLSRCFSDQERDYMKNRAESAAACFAAKEAYAKALGTGFRSFSMRDIEIFHDELGRPYIKGSHAPLCSSSCYVHLTLSHDRDSAIAFVVIEESEER